MSGSERDSNDKQSELTVGGEAQNAPAALPPSTNRGVGVSIHWLSITVFKGPSHAMELVLSSFFGATLGDRMDWSDHFYLKPHGARGYRSMWSGPEGTRLYGYPITGEHCHYEIPGFVLEKREQDVVLRLLQAFARSDFEWRITRLDIAFDNAPFTPHHCKEAWADGDVRTKAHRDSWSWRDSEEGATFYIGSRKSERMVRVYDRRGPTRLELELKGDWADSAAKRIAISPTKQWLWDCLGILRDFVDFQHGDQRPGRADPELLPWWNAFVAEAEKAELKRPDKTTANELDRLRGYVRKAMPSIYILQEVDGIIVNELLAEFQWELKPTQQAKMARLKALKDEEGDGV